MPFDNLPRLPTGKWSPHDLGVRRKQTTGCAGERLFPTPVAPWNRCSCFGCGSRAPLWRNQPPKFTPDTGGRHWSHRPVNRDLRRYQGEERRIDLYRWRIARCENVDFDTELREVPD